MADIVDDSKSFKISLTAEPAPPEPEPPEPEPSEPAETSWVLVGSALAAAYLILRK